MRNLRTLLALGATGFATWHASGWIHAAHQPEARTENKQLEVFEIDELLAKRKDSGRSYLNFLQRSTLSCGLYVLEAGATDGQRPHAQDEVYHVLDGVARFSVGEQGQDDYRDVAVKRGSVLFVGAGAAHRFHSIERELRLLVFFSKADPAEGEGGGDDPGG